MKEIYFDHASTSYPKPFAVIQEITHYFEKIGVSPSRSNYKRAIAAEEVILKARTLLATLFKIKSPHQIVFTLNATHALNIAIKGTLTKGDHVIITDYEHNAVLRPLETLKQAGVITYDIIKSDHLGNFDIELLETKVCANTKLIIVNHGSNVLGSILPIEEIGQIARKHNILFLVDGSQTAGLIDIDVDKCNIDLLAFTGHKSLMGPSGTGGLYVRYPELLHTLYEGGTGSNSISLLQPETMPTKFEAGTINYLGIAGLVASLNYLLTAGVETLFQQKMDISQYCLHKLQELPEVVLYGNSNIATKLPLISFNIVNILPQEVAYLLDTEYNIMVRSGLHCAPLIHTTIGTFPNGTTRISFGYQNSQEQVELFYNSVKENNCMSSKLVRDFIPNIIAQDKKEFLIFIMQTMKNIGSCSKINC